MSRRVASARLDSGSSKLRGARSTGTTKRLPSRSLLLLVLGMASVATAASPASTAPRTIPPEASALAVLAARVAEEIVSAKAEPPIALRIEGANAELTRGFGTLLAAKLSARQLPASVIESEGDAGALARERQARTLARIQLELVRDRLRARGDVLGTWVNFWSGTASTRPSSPAAVIALEAPADALAVALAALPPPAQLELVATVLGELPTWPGAIAAADLDGDGRAELIALDDGALRILGSDGGVRATHGLNALPLAATPCREPFGTLAFEPPARVAAFPCGRARGELVEYAGDQLRKVGTLELPRTGSGDLQVSAAFEPGQSALSTAEKLISVTTRGGYILRALADGSLRMEAGSGAGVLLVGAGTSATLVDLDGDGAPELVSASELTRPDLERLRVWRIADLEEALARRSPGVAEPGVALSLDLRTATKTAEVTLDAGRVLMLAAGDLDADGREEIVAASWQPDGRTTLWRISGRSR